MKKSVICNSYIVYDFVCVYSIYPSCSYLSGLLHFIFSGVMKRYTTVAVNLMCVCYCQGPFATFKMQQDKDCDWTGLKFSPDGKLILISTNGQVIRLIDAFQGTPLQTFTVNTVAVFLYDKQLYRALTVPSLAIKALFLVSVIEVPLWAGVILRLKHTYC